MPARCIVGLLLVMTGIADAGRPSYQNIILLDQATSDVGCPPQNLMASMSCHVMMFDDLKAGCLNATCSSGFPGDAIYWLHEEVKRFKFRLVLPEPVGPVIPKEIVFEIEVTGIDHDVLEADGGLTHLFEQTMKLAVSEGLDVDQEIIECHMDQFGVHGNHSMHVSVGHESVSVWAKAVVVPPPEEERELVEVFKGEKNALDEIIVLELGKIPGFSAAIKDKENVKAIADETEVELPVPAEPKPEPPQAPTPEASSPEASSPVDLRHCHEHISEEDAATLEEVVELINSSIYTSMDDSHAADVEELANGIKAIERCSMDFEGRLHGDLKTLQAHATNDQRSLNFFRGVVDKKTVANASAWLALSNHMDTILDAPECPDFPSTQERNVAVLDVYFESSRYVHWYTSERRGYFEIRDEYLKADRELASALAAYDLWQTRLQQAYCDWNDALLAACASYSDCFDSTSDYYTRVLVPKVQADVHSRVKAFEAGETAIAHIKFLMCMSDSADLASPVDASRFEMTYLEVPTKDDCDLSPLHDSFWDPPITCEAE